MKVQGLKKNYGKSTVVDNVSFEIHKGMVTSFIGPNGAGKTTIIQELKKELEKRRIKACFTKEPTDNELGCFVRE